MAFVVAVTAAAVAIPAFAGHTTLADGNDTRGKLDARSVAFDHEASPLRWRIVTFGGWTVREIWDKGYVVVQLDTRGDERVDHLAVVRSDGRKLVGTLYRVRRDGTQRAIATLPAGKSGPGGVSVSVPFHRLTIGSGRLSYFWSVVTSFTAAACPRTCLDLVPNVGMVEQPLPGVTPTPTPSPTPTPTPTP
ncbi:MAG: hypothetical protein ACXWEH_01755 [Actinomycetota bacterium]